MGPLIADGGLATALQDRGLPPGAPVDDWVVARPADVVDAHRAFVEAGADLILAGTFRTLPTIRADWRDVADAAVGLAREAARSRPVAVYASIGPAAAPGEPLPDGVFGAVAAHVAPHIDGIVLETFVDPAACALAVREVAPIGPPVVASLVVSSAGTLFSGAPARPALLELLEQGATAVGLNCGDADGAVRALEGWDGPPIWLRPGRTRGPVSAWVDGVRGLFDRAAVVGGCCGVPSGAIRELTVARARCATSS